MIFDKSFELIFSGNTFKFLYSLFAEGKAAPAIAIVLPRPNITTYFFLKNIDTDFERSVDKERCF